MANDSEARCVATEGRCQALACIVVPALALCVLLSGGCTSLTEWRRNGFKVGPNYRRPAAPVAAEWIDDADPRVDSARPVDDDWWELFGDPELNGLIETAYRQNLDLRTAGTRILEARAKRNIAAGNLFPQSQGALGAYAHAQLGNDLIPGLPLPNTLNFWTTGFNASWELDFWGRYRRSIEAANAEFDGSVEAYHDAMVLLLAEVAANYVQLRTFQQRLEFAYRNVEVQHGSLEIAEARFRDGTTSELDVQQARSSLSQTRSAIPPLKAGLRQASNRLCVLLGVPPHELAGLLKRQPIPVASPQVAVGIPADLLRRRPDIRRAERAVAAQSAQIGVATADLYPRFALNGYLGYAADDLKDLFASKSFTSFIIPTFQWNILNYGRLRNNIRGQEAKLRGKVLDYQQTVLKADREVEDALVAFLQSQEQANELAESARATQRSVELVVAQYKGGIADFNRVYNTQSLLATQQDQVAQVQGNIATNLIAVYRALGGGWQYFACRSTNGVREGLPATREPLVEAQEEGESVIPKPGDTKPNRSEELVAPKDPHDDSSK